MKADSDANDDFPIAVDLVLVQDPKAMNALGALRAAEWFHSKADLARQFDHGMTIYSWELVPGATIENMAIKAPQAPVVGALVFANYSDVGNYRADVSKMRTPSVKLHARDFTVEDGH